MSKRKRFYRSKLFSVFLLWPSFYFSEAFSQQLLKSGETYGCAEGFFYSKDEKLCVDSTSRDAIALGPPTSAGLTDCEFFLPKNKCQEFTKTNRWPLRVMRLARGNKECMNGAKINANGVCQENEFVYGPFAATMLDKCLAGGFPSCELMKWKVQDFARLQTLPNVAPRKPTDPTSQPPHNPAPDDGKSISWSVRKQIVDEAATWKGQLFKPEADAQCAEFVRTVLASSCNARFASERDDVIQTFKPWDYSLLTSRDVLWPSYANSLAGEELGERIFTINDLQPGDLVFLRNTYGYWPKGVITHVGVAVGNGQMIDRSTWSAPVEVRDVNTVLFVGGLRLKRSLCGGD